MGRGSLCEWARPHAASGYSMDDPRAAWLRSSVGPGSVIRPRVGRRVRAMPWLPTCSNLWGAAAIGILPRCGASMRLAGKEGAPVLTARALSC